MPLYADWVYNSLIYYCCLPQRQKTVRFILRGHNSQFLPDQLIVSFLLRCHIDVGVATPKKYRIFFMILGVGQNSTLILKIVNVIVS